MVIEMEIREIIRRLSDGDHVLDVGCANGYSTVQFALQQGTTVRGLDYIPEMVERARERLASFQSLQNSVTFGQGDVTNLPEPSETYDKVVSIRVIINLGDWDRQIQGLRECARVLKPGGALFLSEATVQGWQRLNEFRKEWQLPNIPMPPFNSYLDEDKVVDVLSPMLKLVELVNFASSYYVATRVLKPLLINALGASIDPSDPDMHWNQFFSQLPPWGDYGTQKLFVFRKQSV